jgi:hypothetical protein
MTDKKPNVKISDETWEDVFYVFDLNRQQLYNRTSCTKAEAEEIVAFEISENPDAQFDILQAVRWDVK